MNKQVMNGEIKMIDWKTIKEEAEIKYFFSVSFKIDGHVINVQKEMTSESKMEYMIYIDDFFRGNWNEENMPIIKKVFYKKIHYYKAAKESNQRILKFNKDFPDDKMALMDESYSTLIPFFSSATTWINQFKKIEGIELR